MGRKSRSTALAAVLLTAALAAPATANATRASQRAGAGESAVAVFDAGTGWFDSLIQAAWGWLAAVTDQDNGGIMP